MKFEDWLQYELKKRDVDEVFCDYISSLLNSGESLDEWLQELLPDDSNALIFSEEIKRRYDGKDIEIKNYENSVSLNNVNFAQLEEKTVTQSLNCSHDTLNTIKATSTTKFRNSNFSSCNEAEDHEVLPETSATSIIHENIISNPSADIEIDENFEFGDVEDEMSYSDFIEENEIFSNDPIDWIELADELEYMLAGQSPSTVYSLDIIMTSLQRYGGNINQALCHILYTERYLQSHIPCRHELNGGCYRKGCYFEHQLGDIPCRYWMTIGCSQSSDCPFLHSLPNIDNNVVDLNSQNKVGQGSFYSLSSANSLPYTPNIQLVTDQDFPALSPPSVPVVAYKPVTTSTTSALNHHKNSSPSTSAKHLLNFRFVPKESTSSSSSSTAPSPPPLRPASSTGGSTGTATGRGGSSGIGATGTLGHSNCDVNQSMLISARDWVDSGSSVALDYQQRRREARDWAIARNKYLEEATTAYLAGAKEVAKRLSAQGRIASQNMKAAHQAAAKQIFSKRNHLNKVNSGVIDIHGLHIAEAKECLEEFLPYFRQLQLKEMVIITGSGHHSSGPQNNAKLLPAVQLYLNEFDYKYSTIVDNKGYIGGFRVRLMK